MQDNISLATEISVLAHVGMAIINFILKIVINA